MTVDPIVFVIFLFALPFLFLRKENRDVVKTSIKEDIDPRGGIIVVFADIVNFIRSRGCKIIDVQKDKVHFRGVNESWVIKIVSYGEISFVNVAVINSHPLLGEEYKKDWEQSIQNGDSSILLLQIKSGIMALDQRIEQIESALD